MSREIYSEGRVVGSSAYEIYLKQHMALFPDPDDPDNVPPASERQWLAASLAMGSSLLLKIPQDSSSGKQTKSIPLPANSRLVAGNIIYGSLFLGDATFDTNGWATKITAYRGVENTSSSSPVTGNTPPTGNNTLDATATQRIKNYMKFHDWSITFDSNWELSGISAPYMDLKPDFSYGAGKSYLSVTYDGPLDSDVYVLLTGFTSRSILAGIVGDNGSVDTDRPEDGDFLGPEIFPWTAPVILIVPNEVVIAGIPKTSLSISDVTYTAPSSATGSGKAKVLKTDVDGEAGISLAMTNALAGTPTQITISQNPSSAVKLDANNSHDNITWSALLHGLANDQGIDVLNDRLKSAKQSLIKAETTATGGCPYLEFGSPASPKRLYISSVEPKGNDIPLGSIGIGWGLDS